MKRGSKKVTKVGAPPTLGQMGHIRSGVLHDEQHGPDHRADARRGPERGLRIDHVRKWGRGGYIELPHSSFQESFEREGSGTPGATYLHTRHSACSARGVLPRAPVYLYP